MKRSTARASVTVALVASIALTACSTDSAGNAGGGAGGQAVDDDAVVLVSSTAEQEEDLIAAFNEEYPDIKVQVRTAPAATYAQVVSTQLAGGTAGDVIRIFPGNGSSLSVVQLTDKGFLADLSDQPFAQDLPAATENVMVSADGKVSGVPMTQAAIGGIYNQGALDATGLSVPTTWPEVLSFCADATAKGKVAYGLGLKDNWVTQLVPYALSATLVGSDPDFAQEQAAGTKTFENSAWRQVFDEYAQMKDAGCFTAQPNGTGFPDVQSAFLAGDVLGVVGINNLIPATDGVQQTFAPFPATDDASQTLLSTGIGVVFGVNAASKHLEDAKTFAQFASTPQAQAIYAKASTSSPALEADDSYTPDQSGTVIADYAAQGRTSSWPDQTWPNPAVQQTHFSAVQGLFAGSTDVDGLLKQLDAAYAG